MAAGHWDGTFGGHSGVDYSMIVRWPGWVQECDIRAAGCDASGQKLPDAVQFDRGARTREAVQVVVIPVASMGVSERTQAVALVSVNPGLTVSVLSIWSRFASCG